MKTAFLGFAFAIVAVPSAHAYVQSGHLPKSAVPSQQVSAVNEMPTSGSVDPVNPAPEPGTMALASLGLLALGAAARRRRSN